MSSDYISRLRSELLRAGATEPARVRPARTMRRMRPLAVAGAAALLVAALVFTVARPDRGDDRAVPPTATARISQPVAPGAGELAAKTVRERLAATGISPAFVSNNGDQLEVAVPPDKRAAATALMAPGPVRASTTGRPACSAPTAGRRPTTRRSPAARMPAAPARSPRPRHRSGRRVGRTRGRTGRGRRLVRARWSGGALELRAGGCPGRGRPHDAGPDRRARPHQAGSA